jgi:hypothetical protein
MRRSVLLVSIAAAIVALPALAHGTAGDSRIYVPIGCGKVKLVYKPRAMCLGNGGNYRRLVWITYGGKRATAHGQFERNDCVPNCAEGTSTWVRTRVTVSRVRWACGKRIYTRLGAFRLWVPGFDRCSVRR